MKYIIEARGYSGEGPSIPSILVDSLSDAKTEIEDLLESDHSVMLYELNEDGSKTKINFEYYTRVHVYFCT